MLNGQSASKFLERMGARIKKSHKIDGTDKLRCYQIVNSKNKVQIFFDAKTVRKCRFKFDSEVPMHILGVSEIEQIFNYSTAIDRVKINTLSNIFQCYLSDETAFRNLIEYFEK